MKWFVTDLERTILNLLKSVIPESVRQFEVADSVLDFLFPPRCPFCDCVVDGQAGRQSNAGLVCSKCKQKNKLIQADFCLKCGKPVSDPLQEYCMDCRRKKHHFAQGRSLFSYQGDVRSSLYRFKNKNRREYARYYASEMAYTLGPWISGTGAQALVPVPLFPARQRERGYNQASLLAHRLSGFVGLPVAEDLVFRVKKTAPQKQLSKNQRERNLSDVFAAKRYDGMPKRVILMDDIYTTGNTVDAVAKELLKAGCTEVSVLTAAIGG